MLRDPVHQLYSKWNAGAAQPNASMTVTGLANELELEIHGEQDDTEIADDSARDRYAVAAQPDQSNCQEQLGYTYGRGSVLYKRLPP